MRAGPSQQSGDIVHAWMTQVGTLMGVVRNVGAVTLPPYDGDPASLSGRRVRLVDGRWFLNGAAA